jgi:aspartyl/asparaginyl-tRNA synthetase
MKKNIADYHTREVYHDLVTRLRIFFIQRGFQEIDTQSRLSILAACEDPMTIATFEIAGQKWPLPQTGQMWLEDELLRNPALPGVFCLTTSYRDEPNPIPDRHLRIFPLFEFEHHGDMETLQTMLAALFEYLGFGDRRNFIEGDYVTLATSFGVHHIEAAQEIELMKQSSPIFFLRNFPPYSNPYFNMKKSGDVFKKIDTIVYGMETVGSAERSCNIDEMRESFYTTSNGLYARHLFDLFGQVRVEQELDAFLSYKFFPRCGGGIGMHRLMRALTLQSETGLHAMSHLQYGEQQTGRMAAL